MSHVHHYPEDSHTPDVTEIPPHTPPTENAFLEILRFALIALVIVLPVRWFLAEPYVVSGSSMETTFHNSEYLIVDKLSYRFDEPARGDVIILKYPKDPSTRFIKRIVGLPGETIHIDGNRVTIINSSEPNGIVLEEPYVASWESMSAQSKTLGPDEYFVMGDNRDHSSDSRAWGVLKRDEIIGRPFLRLFPPRQLSIWPGMNE